jgi:hypothetical protein
VTLAQVRLTLAEEDKKQVEEGRSTSHNISPSAFLLLGMDLQGVQYVLYYRLRSLVSLTLYCYFQGVYAPGG